MMKKVAVVGWDDSINNMGDRILIDTASYLVERTGDCSAFRVDWMPTNGRNHNFLAVIYRKCINRISMSIVKACGYKNGMKGRLSYSLRRHYYNLLLNSYYRKQFSGASAVVVAGGALKYETQEHGFFTECLIAVAKELDIPVMLNAVGIEQYSDKDIRCNKLIDTLNSSTVRCVTTRDDFNNLKSHFVYNDEIVIGKVGDPALWIPECFHIIRNTHTEVVGVNLIREGLFSDYRISNLSDDYEYELYKEIIDELDRRGYKWKLFCNGIDQDYRFGENFIRKYNLSKECLLPIAANTREFVETIAGFKGVIAGRMHACITSYSLDVPVSAFVWGIKIKHFASSAHISEFFAEGKKINGKIIVDNFERALAAHNDIDNRNKLRDSTYAYIKQFCSSF